MPAKKQSSSTSYWLVKSEPDCYSIDNLKSDRRTIWDGVRNYQARNYLVEMKPGDQVLFYHSSTEPAGVAGIASVVAKAAPDPTQFVRGDEYFDPKATRETPRWFAPTLGFVKKFNAVVPLAAIKAGAETGSMVVTQRGSRLSVNPVLPGEFAGVVKLSQKIKPQS